MAIAPPCQCPVCSAELRCHSEATATEFEEWEYDCGAIIQREDNGMFFAYAPCREAMREAVDLLNMRAKAA